MTKSANILLRIIAVLLILNGILNVFDDGMVRTYDIASILSGVGFLIIAFPFKKNK